MLAGPMAGMVPTECCLILPEAGNPNEFKRAVIDFLFRPDIFQEICSHDWDIVSIGDNEAPVYCCNRCDKVGDYVNY